VPLLHMAPRRVLVSAQYVPLRSDSEVAALDVQKDVDLPGLEAVATGISVPQFLHQAIELRQYRIAVWQFGHILIHWIGPDL